MALNGFDYTKKLAAEREYFQDASQKVKEAAQKRVDDTNARADHVMEKQRKNFIEDRAELEKSNKKYLSSIDEKVQSTLSNDRAKYQSDLEKERKNFVAESGQKSQEFDRRLHNIRSSYQKAFTAERQNNEELHKSNKLKYETNVKDIRNESDTKIKENFQKLSESGKELKEQYANERNQLVDAQENRLIDANREAIAKRAELESRISNNKDLKRIQEAEKAQMKQYYDGRHERTLSKFKDQYESMTNDYTDRSRALSESERKNTIKENIAHQEQIAEITTGYNDTIKRMELEKRRYHNGAGDFNGIQQKQQGIKDQDTFNKQLDEVKDQLADAKRTYQERALSEQKNFNTTLKEQSINSTANLERKLNEVNLDKVLTVTQEKEKSAKDLDVRDDQNRADKTAFEMQLMIERNNANSRISKLKENFNNSMKQMEEKHKLSLEEITKSSNKDKMLHLKNLQQSRTEEIFEMKRAFGKMMDSTVQEYEQRLATFQRENEYIKMTMNQKIQNIIDQSEKQLESQRAIFLGQREADIKGQQMLRDERENQLKKNFTQMNLNFQKKIDKMQLENESRMKLITNEYETKLKDQKGAFSKEMSEKDVKHQMEMASLKQTYEDEKMRLTELFRNQIDSLKVSHQEQLNQMSHYKKLS